METKVKIEELEAKKLELSAMIQEADGKALKCYKMGLVFKEEYPAEFERYSEARAEYNRVEKELEELYKKLEEEEQIKREEEL